jgi:hypothetical protein
MQNPVQQALDHLEILNLYATYTYAVDEMDIDGFVECFISDATIDLSSFVIARRRHGDAVFGQFLDEHGVARGRENLRKLVSTELGFHHATTNIRIEFPEPDRARGTAYFVVFTKDEGRIEHYGRYEDDLMRCDDSKWRFSSRVDVAIYERDHALPHNHPA